MTDASTPQDRWTAAHCRVLGRLFAICGAAGAMPAHADAALALTALSGQLAWHAELLGGLLPTRPGTDAAALVAAPLGADRVLDRLDALCADGDVASVCAVLARVVLPRLLAAIDDAAERTDARVDGPRARALTLVARDLEDARRALEPVAERALAAPSTFRDAVRQCADAEGDVVTTGAVVGLVADADIGRRG